MNSARTGLSGLSLLAVRLLLTLLVAVVSWRFVEEPIRRRQWLRSWRGACATGAAAVGTAVMLAVATIVPAAGGVTPSLVAQGRSSMKPTEVSALRSVDAFGSHPLRFLLFGDSVALTAGLGLRIGTQKRYGVEVLDRGILGCDLDQVPSRLSDQVFGTAPGQNCWSWWTKWSRYIAQFHPQVVGLLIGRFELADHLSHGKWMRVGEKAWDDHLEAELDRVIKVTSAGGAKVRVVHLSLYGSADRGAQRRSLSGERTLSGDGVEPTVTGGGRTPPRSRDIDRPQSDSQSRRALHQHDRRRPGAVD